MNNSKLTPDFAGDYIHNYLQKSNNLTFEVTNYNCSFRLFGQRREIDVKIFEERMDVRSTCLICGHVEKQSFVGVADFSYDSATETFTVFMDLGYKEGYPLGDNGGEELHIFGGVNLYCPNC